MEASWGPRSRVGIRVFFYSFSAHAGRGKEQAPGWPVWDGLEQGQEGMARPARAEGRKRRLVSLTSTSTARGLEDIVRHYCHGHREIITDASVLRGGAEIPLERLVSTTRKAQNQDVARVT